MRGMLQHMTRRLLARGTFEESIQVILDDAIALHGAEYGNIQLISGDELLIVAQRGLSAAFLHAFRRVKKDDGCACGRALRLGESVVITDVDSDPEFARFRGDAATAKFRSVQSTPMYTQAGVFLGVISTHFAQVHAPSPIEMQTLKEYSVIAADHLHQLLSGEDIAGKAQEMSDELYARFAAQEADAPFRAPEAEDPKHLT